MAEVLFGFRADMRGLVSGIAAGEASLRRFQGSLSGSNRSMVQFGSSLDGGRGKAERFRDSLTALATTATAVMQAARMGADLAGAGFGALVTSTDATVGRFARFDAGIRSVAASMGLTSAEMASLGRLVMSLGIQTEFTISEVQKAALALAQMGATKDDLEPLLKTVLNIAGVTKTDLGRAAEIVKQQMQSFGLSVADLTRLQTILIQAHTTSAATLEKLGSALEGVGAVAKSTGHSLEDIVPAIEAMIDGGIDASTAGTGISQMLIDLVDPSDKAREALSKLGIPLQDVSPKFHKLTDIVERLGKANIDLESSTQIFEVRAAKAAIKLVELEKNGRRGADAIRFYASQLGMAAEAERKVRIVRDGVLFQWKQLSAAYDAGLTVLGQFGVELLNAEGRLKSSAQQVVGLVEALSQLKSDEFREIVIRVFAEENLAQIWEQAAVNGLPALAAVMRQAFLFGARQLIELAPAIGMPLAKGLAKSVAGELVDVSRLFENLMLGAIEGLAGGLVMAFASVVNPVLAALNQAASIWNAINPLSAIDLPQLQVDTRSIQGEIKLALQGGARSKIDAALEDVSAGINRMADSLPSDSGAMLELGKGFAQTFMGETGKLDGLTSALRALVDEMKREGMAAVAPAMPILNRGYDRSADSKFGADLKAALSGSQAYLREDTGQLVELQRQMLDRLGLAGRADPLFAVTLSAMNARLDMLISATRAGQQPAALAAPGPQIDYRAQLEEQRRLTVIQAQQLEIQRQMLSAQQAGSAPAPARAVVDQSQQTNITINGRRAGVSRTFGRLGGR